MVHLLIQPGSGVRRIRSNISLLDLFVKSNRTGIWAWIKCVTEDGVQIDEVRSGGSYHSQNYLRVNFGLGQRTKSISTPWTPKPTTVSLERSSGKETQRQPVTLTGALARPADQTIEVKQTNSSFNWKFLSGLVSLNRHRL